MTAKPFRFSKRFDEAACDFCGLCFHQCPVLALPLEEAQAEIRGLVHGGRSKVLARCTGCMACARACPVGAIEKTDVPATVKGKRSDKLKVHRVIQDKCIKCGMCRESCKFDAVEVK